MSVTIYDIAKAAGVGVGTVSRVLNNHPSVSPNTRAHVLAIAAELDYRPNASAQRLARKKSRTITVIMPYITNYFFVEMLRGIQDMLFQEDYDLLLYGVNHPKQIEGYLHRSLRVGHADGILLASLDPPAGFSRANMPENFPLIMLDRRHGDFDSFSVENSEGARLATEHLLTIGHRRIAMMTGYADTIPSIERSKGYRAALSAYNAEDLGIHYPNADDVNDGFTKEAGYDIMMRILDGPPEKRPTAMFIASDIQAIGALHALQERGLSCPGDMSLVGFDDIELAQYYGITTMRQPIATLGSLATQRLFERLDHPQLDIAHRTFTPELVVRRTTQRARQHETTHHVHETARA